MKEETCRSRCSGCRGRTSRGSSSVRSSQSSRGSSSAAPPCWRPWRGDAIDLGSDDYIDVNSGSGAWTALGLVIVGSLAALAGTIAAVVSWIGALLNTWQLEDKMWFGLLLAEGLLGLGVVAMIAYVVASSTAQSRAWHAQARGAARENRGKSSSPCWAVSYEGWRSEEADDAFREVGRMRPLLQGGRRGHTDPAFTLPDRRSQPGALRQTSCPDRTVIAYDRRGYARSGPNRCARSPRIRPTPQRFWSICGRHRPSWSVRVPGRRSPSI